MANPDSTYNDGNIAHGAPLGDGGVSGVFTVQTGSGVRGVFKFEGVDVQRPSNGVRVNNPDGSPQGGFGIKQHDTMSSSVQVPTPTGPFIRCGDSITENFNTDGFSGEETFVCETAPQAYPVDNKWMQQTTWVKVYNTGSFTQNPQ